MAFGKLNQMSSTLFSALLVVLERWFLPKALSERRAIQRGEAMRKREEEAERLDRLRHPGDYAGR